MYCYNYYAIVLDWLKRVNEFHLYNLKFYKYYITNLQNYITNIFFQEEEMMEIEASSTPRGTTPTSNCFPSISHLRQQPSFQQQHQLNISSSTVPRGLKSTLRDNGVVITPHLAPQSEYEVSSSASRSIQTTTSPHLSTLNRNPLTKSASNPPQSPDSAIHSAYYSPSQSPIDQQAIVQSQSRQFSGLSSPFSLRTTPASSLSRNNSDASQYGSSSITSLPSSVSVTTSPISSSNQYSPTNSPIQTRHHSGGGGHPQQMMAVTGHVQQTQPPILPSSPLPQSIASRAQLTLPPALHGIVLQKQEEHNRSSGTVMSEYMEGPTQEYMDDKTIGISAQPGISRQQLINRYVLLDMYFEEFLTILYLTLNNNYMNME